MKGSVLALPQQKFLLSEGKIELRTRLFFAGKLPFSQAPQNEDHLPELHLALYNNVIVFDQATKLAYCVAWVHMDRHPGISEAYLAGKHALAAMSDRIAPGRTPDLPLGKACSLSFHKSLLRVISNLRGILICSCLLTIRN